MLEPEKLFDRIVPREGEFIHRRTDSLTSDDIAEAVKKAGLPVTIVTLAEPTNAASELIKLSCGQIETVSAQERAGAQLCSLFPVSEEEAKKTAVAMNGGCLKRFSLKKSVFALTRERALKYAAVGAGLPFWPQPASIARQSSSAMSVEISVVTAFEKMIPSNPKRRSIRSSTGRKIKPFCIREVSVA